MKSKLEKISQHLKTVHKHLLENERIAAEIRLGHKITPLEFFNLLTRDDGYVWMKPLSVLMAEIDEFIDENETITEQDVAGIGARVEFILRDPASKVSARYLQYLPQDTDLVLAHSSLLQALMPLSKSKS